MNASISASVIVEREEDLGGREVLFVVRQDGLLGFPGGLLEIETPLQCAEREFLEETGHKVTTDGLLKIITIREKTEKEGVSIWFAFHGIMGPKVTEAELEMRWLNGEEFIQLLAQGKIYLPQFLIPSLWESTLTQMAGINIIFQKILPRHLSL